MAKVNKSKRNKSTDVEEEIFTEIPVVEEHTDTPDVSDVELEVTEEPVEEGDIAKEIIGLNPEMEQILEDILDVVKEQHESEVEVTVEAIDDGSEEDTVEIVVLDELTQLQASLKDVLRQDELDHYTLDQLYDYVNNKKRQSPTPRGNFKISRTRSVDLDKWSVSELEDWIEGRIVAPELVSDEEIMEEIYLRWQLPSNWTHEAVRLHLTKHINPEKTKTGELMDDRRREACDLNDMTFSMLCSIYLEEVNTRHSSEDALDRLKTVIRATSDEDVDLAIEQYLSGRTLMTNKIEQLISILDTRKKLFKDFGSQLTEATIATNQKIFYNHLRDVCKLEYAEFAESWRSLLRYIDNNYNELFIATRIRRGWGSLDLSQGNLATFDRLLTLLIGTRNGATRYEDVKMLKMDYILEFVTNSKERENISAFYQQ